MEEGKYRSLPHYDKTVVQSSDDAIVEALRSGLPFGPACDQIWPHGQSLGAIKVCVWPLVPNLAPIKIVLGPQPQIRTFLKCTYLSDPF